MGNSDGALVVEFQHMPTRQSQSDDKRSFKNFVNDSFKFWVWPKVVRSAHNRVTTNKEFQFAASQKQPFAR